MMDLLQFGTWQRKLGHLKDAMKLHSQECAYDDDTCERCQNLKATFIETFTDAPKSVLTLTIIAMWIFHPITMIKAKITDIRS